jgi:multidrug efflux system membrane fusion protein
LVTVAPAIAQDVPVYLDEIGKNAAFESVTVAPQVGGRIVERHFQDGADLKKDQLLFVIDPRPYQAQLDSAQASLAQAKAALELAKLQFARAAEIIGTMAISKQDYDIRKNGVDVDEALVQAAQAALETAKLNLNYCYIRSPIEGRAGARLVDVGNVVQANTSALLSIQRLDPIYADFTVTEQDLAEVRRQMAGGTLKTMVRLPSDPEANARTGELEFLDNAVQNGTGTVNLRATLANRDHYFWPGQFVNVKLILATEKGAIVIPNQATQISQQGPFVYVVKPDNTVELRLLTLGQRQSENVVVRKGLAPGERVVVTGQMTLRPGGSVRVQGDAPGTATPAGKQASRGRATTAKGARS